MNLPPLTTGAERLAHILNAFYPGHNAQIRLNDYPPQVAWLELFLQYYCQAGVLFDLMTEDQRKESIVLLKTLRPTQWQKIIIDFFCIHEISHANLIAALTESECDEIAKIINYWDFESTLLALKRTEGLLCSKICSHIWYGEYYRFFSHHVFALFCQLEAKEAFYRLQSYITKDTAHKLVPAIKEDVDILLKWILCASKSSPVKETLKALGFIYSELNENQRKRLISRSVRYYPETFLFILTLITENEAKIICRETLFRMNRFLASDPSLCRTLVPMSRKEALETILSRGRFPLKNSYHHTCQDIFNMLKNIPAYDKEDLDCIESIPPFIFSFFESWHNFKREIQLIINELNEHQLRALSFGINKENCLKLLPELEKVVSPQKFAQLLSLFDAPTIEPYLSAVFAHVSKILEKTRQAVLENNLDEMLKFNHSLRLLSQNSGLKAALRLYDQIMPGSCEWAFREMTCHLNHFQSALKPSFAPPKEAPRSLYALVQKIGDREIGLLDDEDLETIGVHTEKDMEKLERYRSQPKLIDSWTIIKSKRLYSLKALKTGCLIESEEDCFKLHELAVKLL